METRGRPGNIKKEPTRKTISATGKSFYVCNKQHGSIRHATGEYDANGTFLNSLNLLTLILCANLVFLDFFGS